MPIKEIIIAYIIVTFLVLLTIGISLYLVTNHANNVARMAAEQHDFDCYEFVAPDGKKFTPSNDVTH